MRIVSVSDKECFRPKEGEIFFAEVPNKGIDRRIETLLSKEHNSCEGCVFREGELSPLCWNILCANAERRRLIFRRVCDDYGKVSNL